jgi:hypothetical protein
MPRVRHPDEEPERTLLFGCLLAVEIESDRSRLGV